MYKPNLSKIVHLYMNYRFVDIRTDDNNFIIGLQLKLNIQLKI